MDLTLRVTILTIGSNFNNYSTQTIIHKNPYCTEYSRSIKFVHGDKICHAFNKKFLSLYNISLKGRVVVILHGHKAYIVHYIAETKSFDKYLSGMTNILQSLKFETPKISWQTYKNDQYGYSLQYPKGWTVKDQSGPDKREVLIMAPGNLANALIASTKDDNLKDKSSMESAILARKQFKQGESGLKIGDFKFQVEDKKGGWMLVGEKTIEGSQWAVMERGLVDIYGKVLLEQSGYSLKDGQDYKDVVTQILDSFKVE